MSDSVTFHLAAELFDARIGLKPELSFRPRLARALRDAAAEMKISCEDLVDLLPTDAALFDAVLERVTVQESGFFRHPEQFATIAREVLPGHDGTFNAWSAACANGQEAYSLAMVMQEAGVRGGVHASDISPIALRRTSSGSYTTRDMGGVSVERRRRHFVTDGRDWQANQVLRAMITLQRHNLLDAIPPHVSSCQVVMCRNVLIYLEQRHAELFLDRLADAMDANAWLFIGAAETLWQVTNRFSAEQFGASYGYRPLARRSTRSRAGHNTGSPDSGSATAPRPPLVTAAQTARPAPVQPAAEPFEDSGQEYERLGRELLTSGSLQQAVVAFRQWAYMSPDDPAAHSQLGTTLDAMGDTVAGSRAHRAALAALDRSSPEQGLHFLHGFDRAELRRMLVDRCRACDALMRTMVCFRTSRGLFALPVESTLAVRTIEGLVTLPSPREGIVGVLPGDPPLTVLATLGGGGDRVLVAQSDNVPFGVHVLEVLGVQRFDDGEVGPPPTGQQDGLIAGTLSGAAELTLIVDSRALAARL